METNIVEVLPSIINTILLVAIFWYQRNKNKVLSDRINEQSALMKETNSLLSQQSQAIDGQKKVVDSALEYSSRFDISKIEDLIKREIEVEYKETIKDKDNQINSQIKSDKITHNQAEKVAETVATNIIRPLLQVLGQEMVFKSDADRESMYKQFPKELVKPMRKILNEVDQKPEMIKIKKKLSSSAQQS